MSEEQERAVRFEVLMALSMTKQWERRAFAGRAPGKSRKLTVIPGIAAQIARRIFYSNEVLCQGAPANAPAVEMVAASALTAFPAADAFQIAGGGSDEAEGARARLAEAIAVALLGNFEIRPKAFTGLPVVTGNMSIGVPVD